jgi:hypothetical protein
MTRRSRVKNLLKEIWFGNSFYRLALGILNMESGHLTGKDHIGSVNAYQATHIYWRLWKEKDLPEH